MGLASALTTSLTGMTAAETTIDVVGNNLANANTVGFKASDANFATQFLQTISLGAKPSANNGGTDPKQIGLGTLVAEISPDFNQGTISASSNTLDMAIQGEGFFIVQGYGGEQLYTRNGIFSLNGQSQLVTMTGHFLMGYGIDENYNVDTSSGLMPLEIPIGSKEVAEATQNVALEGSLPPTDDVATAGQIIMTETLGNAAFSQPANQGGTAPEVCICEAPVLPGIPATLEAPGAGTGLTAGTTYSYQWVFADGTPTGNLVYGSESGPSNVIEMTPTVADPTVRLNLPDFNRDLYTNPNAELRLYRSDSGGDFELLETFAAYNPDGTDAVLPATYDDEEPLGTDPTRTLDQTENLQGSYTYYTCFKRLDNISRPSVKIEQGLSVDGRIHLYNLPIPEDVGPDPDYWITNEATGEYEMLIYRNTVGNPDDYYLLDTITASRDNPPTFTDNTSDNDLKYPDPINPTTENENVLDFIGPKATDATALVDLITRDGLSTNYKSVFEEGTLDFTGEKGGRTLSTKEFTIEDDTDVSELLGFMKNSLGIVSPPGPDPLHPITKNEGKEPSCNAGCTIEDGQIKVVSNNGIDEAVDLSLTSFQLKATGSDSVQSVDLSFGVDTEANGTSSSTDFIVYDSLGTPLKVRLSFVLEGCDEFHTTYRWYADSADNASSDGVSGLNCGTGLIQFDGEGNYVRAYGSDVVIYRDNTAATSPLQFDLDFGQISGLANSNANVAVSGQDGSAPGTLNSFIIGEDGTIRGIFSNGVTRDLGLLQLARFKNPQGLENKGQNLWAPSVNSGDPIPGNPTQQGLGKVVSGAVELSNTDMSRNLVDLILASTMYRGNARVITTSQELLDELLALNR